MFPLASNSSVPTNASARTHSENSASEGKSIAAEVVSVHPGPAALAGHDGLASAVASVMKLDMEDVSESHILIDLAEKYACAPAPYCPEIVAEFSAQWQQRWFEAVEKGDVKTLDFCIKNVDQCNVNVKNGEGDTALTIAVRNGDVASFNALLQSGRIQVNESGAHHMHKVFEENV